MLGNDSALKIASQSMSGENIYKNEAHLVVNVVPEINFGWRRWQGVILIVVVHMIGLRKARSVTRIMGGLGILVDGWERRCPLLRYHTRAGEKVSLGAIAGRIVQRVVI